MFWNRVKIKKEMIQAIKPTSKTSLKTQCLLMANGDVEKAERLYDFFIKDMQDLPMFDLVQPSTTSQIKEMITNGFSWANENQDLIMKWVEFGKSLIAKKPINNVVNTTTETVANPLPSIN